MMFLKRLLHRMHGIPHRKTFNSSYDCAVGLYGQQSTGLQAYAIDVHRACTALAGIATDVGTCQPGMSTQEFG